MKESILISLKCEYYKWTSKHTYTTYLPEKFWFWLARRLPRKLVYFAIIRAWAYATGAVHTNKTPSEVTWDMVLKLKGEF